jgi:hypothetical protein
LLSALPPASIKRPALMIAMTDLCFAMSIGVTDAGFMVSGPSSSRFFRSHQGMDIAGLGDLADKVAISGAFPGAFPALQTTARFALVESLLAAPPARTIPLSLVDGGVYDNLGLKLLQSIDQEARGRGNLSLPSFPQFTPEREWALDAIIVSDGGQALVAAATHMTLISQAFRAMDVSEMGTGLLRPMAFNVPRAPAILSLGHELRLLPDGVIAGAMADDTPGNRRSFLQSRNLDDGDLERLAKINPARDRAEKALADFRRTRRGPIDLTDVDTRCKDTSYRDAPQCHWRTLLDTILNDITSTVAVFDHSPTLEDSYSPQDIEKLVRFGRYSVLLHVKDINDAIANAGQI